MKHRVYKSLSSYINGSLLINMLLVTCSQQLCHWFGYMRLNQQLSSLVPKPRPAFHCSCKYACMEGQGGTLCVQLCEIGHINCVHAKGHAWLLSLLYSTRSVNGQSTRVTPMSHSLKEVFTDGQLQDARPR